MTTGPAPDRVPLRLSRPFTRRLATGVLVSALAALALGAGLYWRAADIADHDLARLPAAVSGPAARGGTGLAALQSAGDSDRALLVVAGIDTATYASVDVAPPGEVDVAVLESRAAVYKKLLRWEAALLLGHGLGLAGLTALGRTVLRDRLARRLMTAGAAAAVLAAGADAVEDLAVARGLSQLTSGTDAVWTLALVAGLLKWSLLLICVPTSVVALWTCLPRLIGRPVPLREACSVIPPYPATSAAGDDGRLVPAPGADAERSRSHWWAASALPPGRAPGRLGIAVSGGGIRSATVSLGVLQQLQLAGRLTDADYLVSVSGGGYTATAYQMALMDEHGRPVTSTSAPLVEDVFAPGSAEEDHLRRHGQYLADGAAEWSVALLTVLRNAFVSLALIWATVVAAGALAHLLVVSYAAVPLDAVPVWFGRAGTPPAPPTIPAPLYWTPLGLAAAGLVVYLGLLVVFVLMHGQRTQRLLDGGRVLFVALSALAVLSLLVGAGLPLLGWAAARLTYMDEGLSGPSAGIGGGLVTVAAGYVGVLVAMFGRATRTMGKAIGSARSWRGAKSSTPSASMAVSGGAVAAVVTWVAVGVLGVAAAEAFGLTVAMARGTWAGRLAALIAVVLLASLLLDETWLSLHRFYRRRLATAFAVRRESLPGVAPRARPYDFSGEPTRLSTYGQRVTGLPHLIVAAAAHLDSQDRTPPGRRTVSFTFSHDWVGGPQVGWVNTADLETRTANQHLARDVTLQSAAVISGAAFASAMGRKITPYQTLMTLSNARLGTWVPNPAVLHEADHAARSDSPTGWTVPTLPSIRRMPYYAKELFGVHSEHDPLLLVTDGGHFENLGLVELLRHRVRTALVVDASGDTPPLATTLAEAITLAYEELGVRISFDTDPADLIPGTGPKVADDATVSALNARISKTLCVTGTIHYPPRGQARADEPYETGRLVVVKTGLTRDMPYPVLSYAATHPTFPRDTTADQWFDVDQFDAYQAVGGYLGARAVDALVELQDAEGRPVSRRVP